MRNIIILLIIPIITSGCGPLLLADRNPLQECHSVYLVNSPIFSLDDNFKNEFARQGYLFSNSPSNADYIIYLRSAPTGICYRIAVLGCGITTCNCVYFVAGNPEELARMAAHYILLDLAHSNPTPVQLKYHSEVSV